MASGYCKEKHSRLIQSSRSELSAFLAFCKWQLHYRWWCFNNMWTFKTDNQYQMIIQKLDCLSLLRKTSRQGVSTRVHQFKLRESLGTKDVALAPQPNLLSDKSIILWQQNHSNNHSFIINKLVNLNNRE